jgi:lysophospholipase L1-like esterase
MTVNRQGELAFVRLALVGSLVCSVGLGGVAFVRGSLGIGVLAVLALATVVAWFLLTFLHARGRRVGWLLSLAVVNLVLVVPELALRVGGFRAAPGVDFESEENPFPGFVGDADLFWKSNPASPGINSWGFRGAEVAVPKPEGVIRIAYLGDSCTQWGRPRPYPEIVQSLLNQTGAGRGRVESVSLAVAGHTSHQGRVAAEKYLARVDPDVVFVCYGWNDHWLAYGKPDAEVVLSTSAVSEILQRWQRSSRLLQVASSLSRRSNDRKGRPDLRQMLGPEPLDVPRVSAERYRENLASIARVCEQIGAPVVFVTAPSSHSALGTPNHFVDLHYAADSESVHRLHEQYTDVVRDFARASGRRLLDLEREVDALTPDELGRLFLDDGIHFERAGCEFVAQRLVDYLKQEFAL